MRLTKELRAIIVNNAVKKSGVLEKFVDLRIARALLAEEIRIVAFGGAKKAETVEALYLEYKELLKKVPESLLRSGENPFRRDYRIRAFIGSDCYMLAFSGNGFKDPSSVCVDSLYKITPESAIVDGGSDLAQRLHDLEHDSKTLLSLHSDIVFKMSAAVEKFTTTEKMIKVWPESVELLPATDTEARKLLLPAIRTEDLNVLIGLPSKKELEAA